MKNMDIEMVRLTKDVAAEWIKATGNLLAVMLYWVCFIIIACVKLAFFAANTAWKAVANFATNIAFPFFRRAWGWVCRYARLAWVYITRFFRFIARKAVMLLMNLRTLIANTYKNRIQPAMRFRKAVLDFDVEEYIVSAHIGTNTLAIEQKEA